MHTDFNKRHQVSSHPSRQLHHILGRGEWTVKVIKCPHKSAPQRGESSDSIQR